MFFGQIVRWWMPQSIDIKGKTIDGLFLGDIALIGRHSTDLLLSVILDGAKLI